MKRCVKVVITATMLAAVITACSGKHLRINDDATMELCGCSPLPNCVSSSTWIIYNHTPPFLPGNPVDETWVKIKAVVRNMPRTEIVEDDNVYIHAKCTSRVFRFVDNLELLLNPDRREISVRSSSMVALWDLNVNRWRVYQLRRKLEEMKLIR